MHLLRRHHAPAHTITGVIGWYGVFAILAAYVLVTFGLVAAQNLWYILLNLTGALGLVVDGWADRDYQPLALNAVWALVALISLLRVF